MHMKSRSHSIGPLVASRAIVPLLKIQRTMDQTAVFTVSGRLDGENVTELCQLIDAAPRGTPVMVDLKALVLADRAAIRYLRDCETGDRFVLRNRPEYVRPNGYRAAPVKRQSTRGPTSSLSGTAGLPRCISFSTS